MLLFRPVSLHLGTLLITFTLLLSCGYKAADSDDLEPRGGEVVGVLVDANEKSHPDAWIELYEVTGTEPLLKQQGMDSDGRFGVFPPATGVYNIFGSFGDPETSLDKATIQNVSFTEGEAKNIGTIKSQKVGLLTVDVTTPEGIDAEGIKVEVLGYAASTTTLQDGLGAIRIGIPVGTYQVRFSKDGLTTLVVNDVTIEAGEAKVLDDVVMTQVSE